MTDDQQHQAAAADLADAIADLDADLLARMTPDQRAAQLAARAAVAAHFDALWDGLKLRGLDPAGADDSPAHGAAAGLRDLTANLRDMAEQAAHEADDYDDAGEPRLDPAGADEREAERRQLVDQWIKTADLDELEAAVETVNPADILDLAEAIQERRAAH